MRRTVLMALAVMAISCGGQQASSYVWNDVDEASGVRMSLSQGAMPTGQTFTGVYRSPQIGDIEMVQTGDSIVGQYEYDRGSCHVRARIEGTVSGNLLRFNWREDHRPCGRIQPVIGRGYFLYHLEETDGVARGRLFGRWGYQDDDHSGGPWTAFKQMNRQPTMMQDTDGGTPDNSGGAAGSSGGSTSGSGSSESGGSGGSNSGLNGL
jgi:hypothetical protein